MKKWYSNWHENKLDALNKFTLENSDIITYHCYESFAVMKKKTKLLMNYNRPLICTEYMARPTGNTFTFMLPFFKKHKVGAINWGFVSGKSQTIYPWGSWKKEYTAEPKIWFHDILRADGSAYDENEVKLIKAMTGSAKSSSVGSGCVDDKKNPDVKDFGVLSDGTKAKLYTIVNKNGLTMQVTDYGGIIVSLSVPDKDGNISDIVLGYDNVADYVKDSPYFGAIVGRYANRICKGEFSLNSNTYTLAKNNGNNHLHGGLKGFDKVLWDIKEFKTDNGPGLKLHYLSKDGEEGYPGNLDITVTYVLTNDNELKVDYKATTDRTTICNLSQHSYFNLKGQGNGDILDHQLMINADYFTPVDETLIPTGEILSVNNTPMDFTKLTAIGARVGDDFQQLKFGRGYDHNWVLNKGSEEQMTLAASVYEPTSGRVMEVWTTEPGMQFYCGNFLDGSNIGKSGKPYNYRNGFCLETQHYPDSINQPNFPSVILRPGQTYHHSTIFKFSTK